MQVPAMMLSALLVMTGPPPEGSPGSVRLPNCMISTTQDGEAEVPAKESGVLIAMETPLLDANGAQVFKEATNENGETVQVPVYVPVREGIQVAKGALLARIDDALAKAQHVTAKHKYEVAKEEAENDINVRYAQASADVSKAELQRALDVNRFQPGTISDAEMQRRRLKVHETTLAIEQAEMNLRIAQWQMKISGAELKAAEEILERRMIRSPLEGMVVEIYRHVGEAVQTVSDPVVMHVVGLQRLRVEGFLNARDVPRSVVTGRPVTVTVELDGGSRKEFTGQVVFISPLFSGGTDYRVLAEIENRKENGVWLLGPGLDAEMIINVK
ncbi:MAG: HlyD family efflux transporter periplasmic adaptor subunit [Candidatus Nealsonbacteria bacterium]|nr:HlyD family efflux transporter periplasmic adaptor subunit [Candidatus Nealsonbacteria bacterium]